MNNIYTNILNTINSKEFYKIFYNTTSNRKYNIPYYTTIYKFYIKLVEKNH